MKLCFGKGNLVVKHFSNANFVEYQDDHKSTSGHVFLFNSAVVSWSSKKQTYIGRYTMEVKYIACSMPHYYKNDLY